MSYMAAGERDRREEGETHNLPSEMQMALDRILEEDREVFEALARSNTIP